MNRGKVDLSSVQHEMCCAEVGADDQKSRGSTKWQGLMDTQENMEE